MIPGELLPQPGDIEMNVGLPSTTLTVANTGDRPIQVGSHYHFAETTPALSFDQVAAKGQRLDITAGTAVRFEPGQSREVTLIPYQGRRIVIGPGTEIIAGEGRVLTAGGIDAHTHFICPQQVETMPSPSASPPRSATSPDQSTTDF